MISQFSKKPPEITPVGADVKNCANAEPFQSAREPGARIAAVVPNNVVTELIGEAPKG